MLDPFLGGGTTSIAASLLGRDSIGIEISTKYFDAAIKRFIEETKEKSLNSNKSAKSAEEFSENQLSIFYA